MSGGWCCAVPSPERGWDPFRNVLNREDEMDKNISKYNDIIDIENFEQHILERCLHGEEDAWESLFLLYQPRLLAIIKPLLGHRADRNDLAEEIASAVWYSLVVGENARIRRFDPSRGTRLLTYLVALARREIWKSYLRERNRHSRETRAARLEATGDDSYWELLLQEFLATLTLREREFCEAYLLAECADSARPVVSVCNEWQLRSRVRRKLLSFLGGKDDSMNQGRSPKRDAGK